MGTNRKAFLYASQKLVKSLKTRNESGAPVYMCVYVDRCLPFSPQIIAIYLTQPIGCYYGA